MPSIDAFLDDCRINAGTALIGLSLFDRRILRRACPLAHAAASPVAGTERCRWQRCKPSWTLWRPYSARRRSGILVAGIHRTYLLTDGTAWAEILCARQDERCPQQQPRLEVMIDFTSRFTVLINPGFLDFIKSMIHLDFSSACSSLKNPVASWRPLLRHPQGCSSKVFDA